DEFRERKLARIKNPSVIDFWEKEAAKTTGDWSLANMVGYIASKFDNFISNHYMRPIIGQTESAFNFREVMDEGKILLVNLSKGKIGDINSSLLGMLITGKILQAALSRQELIEKGQKDFKDFYLYIDEFQNYTTDSIATILSEARKYKLNLILAHQFIQQLDEKIRDSVFGNVGSMLAFRVGAPDTEMLLKQFSPEFNEKDLISIDNLNCFGKILIGGQPSRPFNMKISLPETGNSVVREKLKELSRLTYGKDATEVENEIVARLRG
ncbi:MAG TPA: TraM recognition domain-containing protein, partial [Candidatus Paceibacterota bacterium]|nr:TraM recognition domain-containing protein [Candidatus Paceibacterota bacterium]